MNAGTVVRRLWLSLLPLMVHVDGVMGQTFNKRFNPHDLTFGATGFSVERNAQGQYVVFCAAAYVDSLSLYYSSVVTTLLVGPTGANLGVDHLMYPQHATYPGSSNSAFPLSNSSGFGLGGNTFTIDSAGNWISRVALYFFDSIGTILSFTELGPDGQEWVGRQAKQTPDGGYVICGETSAVGFVDGFVIKVDSMLNEQWVRTYGQLGTRENLSTIDMAPGGGYYVGGNREITSTDFDPWVIQIDANGDLLWDNVYGTPWVDPANAHWTSCADGNGVIASVWRYSSANVQRICLIKVDTAGSVLWSSAYGPLGSTQIFTVKEVAPGGDLISAGYYRDPIIFYQGLLLRTGSTGDSLWLRHYQYSDSMVSNGGGVFRDVQPTSDGGFIMVGTALGIGTYSQDAWVVKVDSMGCIVPGCHIVTDITTQITNHRDALHVWPNPVSETLNLSWQLPASLRAGSCRLSVVGPAGQLVRTEQVSLSQEQYQLDVRDLAPGVYHLHLVSDGVWVTGGKFVVE